ncbi:MAG TPA: hypothetical protein VGH83_05720, partial [Candidatus Acidoferrum sp.]
MSILAGLLAFQRLPASNQINKAFTGLVQLLPGDSVVEVDLILGGTNVFDAEVYGNQDRESNIRRSGDGGFVGSWKLGSAGTSGRSDDDKKGWGDGSRAEHERQDNDG